jgi:hypothetical protein
MNTSSFIIGIAVGAVAAFGTGFLKKAGEDVYSVLRKRLWPNRQENSTPQVVIHLPAAATEASNNEIIHRSLQPTSIERVSTLSYEEIIESIRKAPPLQQASVSKAYIGLRVEWDTYFKSGRYKDEGKLIRLYLTMNKDALMSDIQCEVPADEYRELGVLPKGTLIRVAGEIAKADLADIELKNVHLQILR